MQKTHLISLIFGAVVVVGAAIAMLVYERGETPETEQTAERDASSSEGQSADVTASDGADGSQAEQTTLSPDADSADSDDTQPGESQTGEEQASDAQPAASGDGGGTGAESGSSAAIQESVAESAAEGTEDVAQDDGTAPSPTDTQTATIATDERTTDGASEDAPADDGRTSIAPSFDVVRVEPTGDTVLAGRAEPNSQVTVLDNGRPLGTVTADDKGEWVFLPDRPLEPGSRELSLESEDAVGTKLLSEDVVVMSVPDTATADSDASEGGRSAEPQEEAIAVLTPRDGGEGDGGSQVLQAPKGEGISEGDLVLEAVDYGQDGGITVSGRGEPGSTVRLYLDNEAIGEVQSDAQGRWTYRVGKEVPFGVYQLRADQVNEDGKVTARVETPFSRVEFARADLPDEKFVIVQPGHSLWRIARGTLGRGVQYTVIYEANADQIRDPALIYPGQIFVVPQTN